MCGNQLIAISPILPSLCSVWGLSKFVNITCVVGDSQSRLCSAGVLAATIIASTDQEEMIEDLLEADCVGKIETIAIILKLSPELLVHNDRIPSILSGKFISHGIISANGAV